MKKVYLFISLVFISAIGFTQTTVTVGGGASITCPATPTATWTTPPTGVTFSNWSRGSGVTCASAANGLSGSAFNTLSAAASFTANKYYSVTITADASHTFTLNSITWLTAVSGTGFTGSFNVMYSNNGGTVTSFGTAGTSATTNTFTGTVNVATNTSIVLYLIPTGTGAVGTTVRWVNASTINLTASSSASSIVNVTPSTLSGFSSSVSFPSAEQSYSVDGSSLSGNIIITPPVGFEISTGTGGSFSATNPIIITPDGLGVVPPTPIYVRMNSATLGLNTGDISNASAAATTQNVALSGNVLSAEPTVQSTITFGAITNSTIQVNFAGGNGAHRILVAKALTSVSADPVDGTTYTGNSVFGSGTNLTGGNYAVYTGDLNTVIVSGLIAGTTYHFAVYEYNDDGVAGAENYLIPGGIGNNATIDVPVTYTWIGGSSLWTTATNWLPTRLFPATNDILLFLDGTTETVTAVPNETIGQLNIMNVTGGTNVTLQAAAVTTTLTIGGNAIGADLTVAAGCQLNIDGANGYTINVATGATATIDGAITFTGGIHKLTAVDASAVTFNSGAVFTAGTGFLSNSFGNANLSSIIFASGSRYDQAAGSNPFGAAQPNSVVTFQTGSLYKIIGATFTPSFSGRTYADVEFDGAGTPTMTGGNAVSIDNLTVTSGTANINMTANPGHSIKGNISVASGATLNFAPATAGTINLNGITPQSINNAGGTISFAALQTLNINNAAGVTLNTPITISGVLGLTSGILTTSATNLLTMAAGSSYTGGNSNASYVSGPVKKIGNTDFTFPIGKANGYVPIGVSNFAGAPATDEFTAEYIRNSARSLSTSYVLGLHHVSGCDYWILNKTGTATATDITAYWSANNVCNGTYVDNLADLVIAHFDGASWDAYGTVGSATGLPAAGNVVWTGVTSFSPFALGSITFANPLPISINYFNGTKQNGSHLLNWKVNCNSTPSATLILERSTDGRNYSEVYNINATALRCQQPFNYTDAAPAKGVNYYRLKMIDATGKISYSSIVSLLNASAGFDILNIAPNPIVGGNFKLNISAAKAMPMDVVITDMQGRVMQKQTVNMIAGFNTIPMNVTNLSAGNYQVYGNTSNGRSSVLRFVIQ